MRNSPPRFRTRGTDQSWGPIAVVGALTVGTMIVAVLVHLVARFLSA